LGKALQSQEGGEMRSGPWLEKSRRYALKLPEELPGINIRREWPTVDKFAVADTYQHTFAFAGEFIDAEHARIASAPLGRMGIARCVDLGIDGYLTRDEALKLYEIARFTVGNILELGTFRGLSTSIMARALHARGGGELETIDVVPGVYGRPPAGPRDLENYHIARANVARVLGGESVTFLICGATERLRQLPLLGRRFGFVFVDHDHGYDSTREAAGRLRHILDDGGFALFHDFLDPANLDPHHPHGVYQACLDTVCEDDNFKFCGCYGSAALFRFRV
jgi:predicted O-methyltransferase YrrM